MSFGKPGHVELSDLGRRAFVDPGQYCVADVCCGDLGADQLPELEFDDVVDLSLGVVLHSVWS